ncbi:flavin reductase family protein [Nesterenkonia muleiensis]|uniref:flavin reductase family protein n=1 Tax=Nesterenkonia muleiensis TaxID=2282648 RepID=UPI000E71EC3F|nr:flavin reductase family protein [Nesterenkonia muleiensis]
MTFLENETTARDDRELAAVGEGGEVVRRAFANFPSGVAALCAHIEGEPVGIVASSFAVGVSFSPPMVLFSVHNDSATWPVLRQAKNIGISVLGDEHGPICRQLASKTGDRFGGLDLTVTHTGAVLIGGSPLWIESKIVSETPAGDHTIIVLQVLSVNSQDGVDPLIFHKSSFRQLQPA